MVHAVRDKDSPSARLADVMAALQEAGATEEQFGRLTAAVERLGIERALRRLEVLTPAAPSVVQSVAPQDLYADLGTTVEPELVMAKIDASTWCEATRVVVDRFEALYPELDTTRIRAACNDDPDDRGWLVGGELVTPHFVVSGLDRMVAAVVTFREPLDVRDSFGHAIRIAFFLWEPPGAANARLSLLSRVTSICESASNTGLLLASDTPDALHDAVVVLDQVHSMTSGAFAGQSYDGSPFPTGV